MSEVKPQDILLRVGPKMLERYQSLAAMGAGRGRVAPVPYTFSRADISTCATEIHRDTIIRTAAAGVPRIEFVDLDGDGIRETPGVLLEGSRVNDWTRSEELNDAVWSKSAATVSVNSATAPDGTVSSDSLSENNANADHFFTRATPTLTNNTRTTITVFARPSSRFWFRIVTTDKAGTARSTWFNSATGLVGTKNAGHDAFTFAKTGDHYRFGVSFDAASGGTAPSVDIAMATADGGGAYAGDGVSGMNFWGMMIEVDKAFPSSYIKTVSASVARAADSLTLPFNFGPLDMTVLVRLARPIHADLAGTNLPTSAYMASLGNNTAPALQLRFAAGTTRLVVSTIDTAAADAQQTQAMPAGAEIVTAFQYRALATGGMTKLDSGAGYTAEAGPASAAPAFLNQVLRLGGTGIAGDELYGGLIDLIIARGLFTRAEMLAIP